MRRGGTTRLALLGVLLAWSSGCEKDRPTPEQPPEGPTVIVEQPGATPVSETGEEASASGLEQPDFGSLDVLMTDVACQSDADCVKDSCCHATSCVAIADAPDCSGAVCTLECRGGTMDCYGGCMCQDGRCAARRWTPPSP